MPSSPITSVSVGGHVYRLQSSASSEELKRYAARLDERLQQLPKVQQKDPKSLVLVALGLVHDLEQAQAAYAQSRQVTEQRLRSLLARIDGALDGSDAEGEALAEVPPASGSAKHS